MSKHHIIDRIAQQLADSRPSPMQESLTLCQKKSKLISFALGLPSPDMFPAQRLSALFHELLSQHPRILQYAEPCVKLKHEIKKLMLLRGVSCSEDEIFLTSGAQQGLSLLTQLLLDPGDYVVLEEVVYPGFYQAIELFGYSRY